MLQIRTAKETMGPFATVQAATGAYRVTSPEGAVAELPHTVVGVGVVEPWTGGPPVPPAPPPAAVPEAVEMRQARLALIDAHIDEQVDAILAGIPGIEGKKARAEWATALTVRRDHPLVAVVIASGLLTEAGADALFVQAALL